MKCQSVRPTTLGSSLISLFCALSLFPTLVACQDQGTDNAQQQQQQYQKPTAEPVANTTTSPPVAVTKADQLPELPKVLSVAPLLDVTAGKPTLVPATDIEAWKASDNRAAMQEHAWRLFAGIMRPVYRDENYSPLDRNAVVRVYDTWHSIDEALPEKGGEVVDFSQATAASANTPSVTSSKVLSAKNTLRQVDVPNQISHHGGMASQVVDPNKPSTPAQSLLTAAVVSDVKYSDGIVKFIQDQLMVTETQNGKKVVKDYKLAELQKQGTAALDFTDTSGIMLKPAYTIVKGNGTTVIARWEEDLSTTNPTDADTLTAPLNANTRVAGERTWTQEAVVVPPDLDMPKIPVYGRDGAKLPVVSVNDFHHFKLTEAQAEELRGGILKELMGPNVSNIEAGDYAILTSMHIATREVDDWTWQTFWWQPKADGSVAEDTGVPADIRALFEQDMWKPLAYFKAGVGYSYTTAAGKDVICSNPYLEGPFGLREALEAVYGTPKDEEGNDRLASVEVFIRDNAGKPINPYTRTGNGLKTNCITCHLAAAYPDNTYGKLPADTQGKYPDYGLLTGDEPLFSGRVKTHFLWGVAGKISEYAPPTTTP